jgi:hypothetical protein
MHNDLIVWEDLVLQLVHFINQKTSQKINYLEAEMVTVFFILELFIAIIGIKIQCLTHARSVFYHWATSPAPVLFLFWEMNGHASQVTTWGINTYPECFMFWGLSIRTASLILRSWSGQFLETVILCHSDCLGLFGVGWRITCREEGQTC